MKITDVRVVRVEGGQRSALAVYETERGGLAPGEVTPYQEVFTLINKSVYKLLGGPTRERIPAYAALPGFSNAPPQRAVLLPGLL